MKRFSTFVAPLLLIASGCSPGLQGSGVSATEKREVPAFTAVEVNFAGTVNINCQAPQEVTLSGDDNILPLITTEVKDGTLYIDSKDHYQARTDLVIDIAVPNIDKLVFNGVGNSKITNVKNDHLSIDAHGAMAIEASGETRQAGLRLSGVGSIDAEKLHAENATIDSTGAGNIIVNATNKLDGSATGVGNVEYSGNPTDVKINSTGIGKIGPK